MESLDLNSRGYYLWNDSLGFAMGENEAETTVPIASLTKMMTALVALEELDRREDLDLTTMVKVPAEALRGLAEFAVVGLSAGQEVSIEDLLYATMLPSAGDAAQALALSVSENLTNFVDLMNARATEIGMTNTHFSNTYGRDEENYSTPADMVKLVQVALGNPEFVEVFETFEKKLPTLGKTVKKTFVAESGDGWRILGGKTGFTNAAGRCLASTAEVEGAKYILVTVGAENGQHVADAEKVYQKIMEDYEPVKIVSAGDKLVEIGVTGSAMKVLKFEARGDREVVLANGVRQGDLEYKYDGVTEITRDTEAGSKLGDYRILWDGHEVFAQEIYYNEPVEFYNYALVGLGTGVSLVLLLSATGLVVWRKRREQGRNSEKNEKRKGRDVRGWQKWLPLGVMILFVLSVMVNYLVFQSWFAPAGETEVYQTELKVVEKEPEAQELESTEEGGENEEDKGGAGVQKNAQQTTPVLGNCTMNYGNLMLINPNFRVGTDFIAARKRQLISLSKTYGIPEYKAGNGDNLMMPEAAERLNEMVKAYQAANPGHEMGTRSCFRERGTTCGRLCAVTGTSDHHTGLTCDLIDKVYGTSLDTDEFSKHKEWQWLKENSYKYGFIDRFPEAWAGGAMTEPINVDANGSTGLFETWHYRYVGVEAATEIATGKYNNGKYDSLEHYLKMTGKVKDLKNGGC